MLTIPCRVCHGLKSSFGAPLPQALQSFQLKKCYICCWIFGPFAPGVSEAPSWPASLSRLNTDLCQTALQPGGCCNRNTNQQVRAQTGSCLPSISLLLHTTKATNLIFTFLRHSATAVGETRVVLPQQQVEVFHNTLNAGCKREMYFKF